MPTTQTKARARRTERAAETTATQAKRTARAAQTTAAQAERTAEIALSDAGFAVLGAADLAVALARRAPQLTRQVATEAPTALRTVAGVVRSGYDDLARRGRKLSGRIADENELRSALAQTKVARKTAGSAVRSAARAVEAGVEAVEEAADEVGQAPPRLSKAELQTRSLEELYQLAAERDLEGRSTMGKDELVAALAT